ncbi:hypothetical protein NEISICOT_00526 [Neisseria sicca ATCC 29256]|uniref:Uncharacterized protein n=1 Tax=Neisseria sicca ATCC 29256 TaxID=547045 RepID=C6M1Y8_NEISI|nr:hypothetical protein NEISICOT_00526 [Neisseria sicca ATCC 29256]
MSTIFNYILIRFCAISKWNQAKSDKGRVAAVAKFLLFQTI